MNKDSELYKTFEAAVRLAKVSDKPSIPPELECKILKLANTNKFSEALPTLEQAVNMYQMLMDAQKAGSKFYEVDTNGEKYLVKFI